MLKGILYFGVTTLVVIILWIAASVIHNYVTSQIAQDVAGKIIPITPSFDQKTLEELKTRETIRADLNETILQNTVPSPSSTAGAILIPTQGSGSARIATSSGT